MNRITVDTYEELSRLAGDMIAAQVKENPHSVLGLATGSSPVGAYQRLIELCDRGEVDFSGVTSVNLDEYVGLTAADEQSYRYFMNHQLFDHINIRKENTHVPDGSAADTDAECRRYDELIRSLGGIDLQLLGIGLDGHIGFNEPADHFVCWTHRVSLDASTIAANARFFEHEDMVPREAVTIGMSPILQARRVLLIANGANKQEILDKAFSGPVTPQIPASILQLHPNVTVIYARN